MRAKIRAWLRTPIGAILGQCAMAMTLFTVVMNVLWLVFDVPERWIGGWPDPWGPVAASAWGAGLALLVLCLVFEVERWRRLREEYAAAQRDIERMERGER